MKSEYAIVLYFDNRTNTIFQNMIDGIAIATGNFYMTKNKIPPHITIGDFFTEDTPNISTFLDKLRIGKIVFSELGSFEPYVLYVAPIINDFLRNSNAAISEIINDLGYEENKLYAQNNWIPHLTIATKLDSKQLEIAYSYAKFASFSGWAERIALVKCNPYKEISCSKF